MRDEKKKGFVTLLGAGCHKDLLTLAGLSALQDAEAVVYDDLLDAEVLSRVSPDCRQIYVGKRSGRHSRSQREIEEILLQLAEEGLRVVRLKGGDSFVFGRGGEEALALQAAGVPFQVIPGVSAGIAVPEHLGIPVTHRGLAGSVTFLTGHTAEGTSGSTPICATEEYETLAALKGTLVVFMGVKTSVHLAEKLMEYGKSGDTPVAFLCSGYRAGQRRIDGKLKDMQVLASQAHTPAILVIGETAALDLRSDASEFETDFACEKDFEGEKDFDGETDFECKTGTTELVITGTAHFAQKLAAELSADRELSNFPVRICPTLELTPCLQNIPDSFEEYTWLVFTSANGVRLFFDEMKCRRRDFRGFANLHFACIGEGTAEALEAYGFLADYMPASYTAKALGEGLGKLLGQRTEENLLLLRAARGSKELPKQLDQYGVRYMDAAIYDTTACITDCTTGCTAGCTAACDKQRGAAVDEPGRTAVDEPGRTLRNEQSRIGERIVIFGSGEGAKAYFLVEPVSLQQLERTRFLCIGEETAKVVRAALAENLPENAYIGRITTAKEHTISGILQKLRLETTQF